LAVLEEDLRGVARHDRRGRLIHQKGASRSDLNPPGGVGQPSSQTTEEAHCKPSLLKPRFWVLGTVNAYWWCPVLSPERK